MLNIVSHVLMLVSLGFSISYLYLPNGVDKVAMSVGLLCLVVAVVVNMFLVRRLLKQVEKGGDKVGATLEREVE